MFLAEKNSGTFDALRGAHQVNGASAAFLVTTSVTLVYEGSLRTYWSNKFTVLLERERV